MNTADLKRYVFENNYVEQILQEIGCHHITQTINYWQCANHDGDNKTAIVVYKEEYLGCVNYTRKMVDDNRSTDLIDLVVYETDSDFVSAIKLICKICDIDVYHDFTEELPKSLQIIRLMQEMRQEEPDEDEESIRVLDNNVLSYYTHCVNDQFNHDGISYLTQCEFDIGYDHESNRITIPIYSEFGDPIGVKGRLFSETDRNEPKYMYIERCPKGCVLYGLNKTMPYIKEAGCVYVFEAEKSVMQCWDMGVRNAVATGGKTISRHQIDMLVRLCVKIIFCFDQDVGREELEKIAKMFPVGVPIYAKFDEKGILKEKASPSDDRTTFKNIGVIEVAR